MKMDIDSFGEIMEKFLKENDIDGFCEIMEKFLKENDIKVLTEMPEGTLKAEVKNNCGIPGIVDLYILLNALPSVFECTFEMIGNDNKYDQRYLVREMMWMVEDGLIKRLGL
ncbi:MAG: hypothetical protein V8R00_01580 [Coprococcus catus]